MLKRLLRVAVALCCVISFATYAMDVPQCKITDFISDVSKPTLVKVRNPQFFMTLRLHCDRLENCLKPTRSLSGDKVVLLAAAKIPGYSCVWFDSEHHGWVPESQVLAAVPTPKVHSSLWLGAWSEWWSKSKPVSGKFIDISRSKGVYKIEMTSKYIGEKQYPTPLSRQRFFIQAPGEIISPQSVENAGCKPDMRLLGEYLLVSDNGRCGFGNATHFGVYKKLKNS
jgi:hypothetical protein